MLVDGPGVWSPKLEATSISTLAFQMQSLTCYEAKTYSYVEGHLITVSRGRGVSEENDEIKTAAIDWRREIDESQGEQEALSIDLRQPRGARKHSSVVG